MCFISNNIVLLYLFYFTWLTDTDLEKKYDNITHAPPPPPPPPPPPLPPPTSKTEGLVWLVLLVKYVSYIMFTCFDVRVCWKLILFLGFYLTSAAVLETTDSCAGFFFHVLFFIPVCLHKL